MDNEDSLKQAIGVLNQCSAELRSHNEKLRHMKRGDPSLPAMEIEGREIEDRGNMAYAEMQRIKGAIYG